jgi:hypothetical protein
MRRTAKETLRGGLFVLILGAPLASAQPLTSIAPPAETSPDTVVVDTIPPAPSRADTARVTRHHFNHREQIIAGTAIMTALGMMMVLMNNYNPR